VQINDKSAIDAGQKESVESKVFRRLRWWLPIGALANILYSLFNGDPAAWGDLLTFSAPFLVLAFLLSLAPWLLNTIRLWGWLRCLDKPTDLATCFNIILGSELGAAVSPTAIGGGAVKVALLMRRGLPAGRALTVISLGTIEDACCNVIVIPLVLFSSGTWHLLNNPALLGRLSHLMLILCSVLAGLLLILFLIDRFTKQGRWIRACRIRMRKIKRDWLQSWRVIRMRGGKRFLINLLIAVVQWSLRYMIFAALAAGLGAPVNLLLFASLQWLCMMFMMLSPTPGAVGGAEAIFLFLHGDILPPNTAAVMMVGWRFLTFYLVNLLGIVAYLALSRSTEVKRDNRAGG